VKAMKRMSHGVVRLQVKIVKFHALAQEQMRYPKMVFMILILVCLVRDVQLSCRNFITNSNLVHMESNIEMDLVVISALFPTCFQCGTAKIVIMTNAKIAAQINSQRTSQKVKIS
jgi:hypothetical protein